MLDIAAQNAPSPAPIRPPRLAVLQLRGLGHFLPDLVAGLSASEQVEVRCFTVTGPEVMAAALAWTDDPARDALWFEFCWPPFPELIACTEFGGRRVIVRVHRIEAYGSPHAARAPWGKVTDVIAVSQDMAARLLLVAPSIAARTRIHVIHNGLDLSRHQLVPPPADPFRIGWCGWFSLHKNPNLALEILSRLRSTDPRWTLHMAIKPSEPVAQDSFMHLAERLSLSSAIHITESISPEAMADWHARNAVLLSTSVYESFGYAIAEAAAAGCDLAVLDYRGAEEFWPAEVRFASVDQAVALIQAARHGRWRSLIEQRFALERQVKRVLAVLAAKPAAAPRPQLIPLRHGTWEGRFPLTNPSDHIQRGMLLSGSFYEADMLEDVRSRLRPGGLFVDVGANIGNHALFAAAICGARVLAFEPSPILAAHCAATLAANGLSAALDLRRAGLGAAAGSAKLLPGPAENAGQTQLNLTEAGDVPVLRLDDVLDTAPDVVKIDVEGMEAAVLRGAQDVLRRHRPALYIEAATEKAHNEVTAILAPLGYRPRTRFNATPTWLFTTDAA
jgi:FkbM family methyltransferase